MYMDYAADRVQARGTITQTAVLIDEARGLAYGAGVTTRNGSIGLDAPFPYRFAGRVTTIDLRNVPAAAESKGSMRRDLIKELRGLNYTSSSEPQAINGGGIDAAAGLPLLKSRR